MLAAERELGDLCGNILVEEAGQEAAESTDSFGGLEANVFQALQQCVKHGADVPTRGMLASQFNRWAQAIWPTPNAAAATLS